MSNVNELLNALITDIKLYHSLPVQNRRLLLDVKKDYYKKYDGILDLFNKLKEKGINELVNGIKDKINKKNTYDNILKEYGEEYKSIICYVLDALDCDLYESIDSEQYTVSEDNQDLELSNDSEEDNKFTWNENQVIGWTNAINSNFASGIHSQATGSGKSLMALKIIWEYHKKNPKNHVMWLCERKDIPQKLFFNGFTDKKTIYNKKNFRFWKKNDIIDMTKFTIKEYVYNKGDLKWIEKLNNIKSEKPLFLIINRAYLTTKSYAKNCKYKYEELKNNIPNFIILDECHSSMANGTYKLLLYMKWNWKANIQGLSATPYRKGKSYTTIDIDIDCPDKEKIRTQENENKLINIFHKQGNVNELNILSWFNLKDAIEKGIILEPIFHWFHIKKYFKKTKKHADKYKNYSDNEIISVMTVLNDIVEECKYKKCVVWCRLQSIADNWYEIFIKEKHKYSNLSKMVVYIDHSGTQSGYDKFYDKEDNAIMFCASKFREGSDIPYLSCCMFLDKVKDRGELPFIQCIGRVLRKDSEKLKEYGHIVDGCTEQDDEGKMKGIINKLLRYYVQLYEISKSDFEMITSPNGKLSQNKLTLYDRIMRSLRLEAEEKKIYIDLNNNKKITLDLDNVDLKTMEWNKIIPNFDKILKNTLIMCDYEEFLALKKRVKQLGIKNVYEYDNNWEKYRLYTINDKDQIEKIEPKKRFSTYFNNWYAFLDRDTSKFIKDKTAWRNKCVKLGINKDNYLDKIKKYPDMPDMPEEFYRDFTNMASELEGLKKSNRLLL